MSLRIPVSIRKTWLVIATFMLLAPAAIQAAPLTIQSNTLGDSGPGASTTEAISAVTFTAASIGSIGFQFCTTSSGGCIIPGGLTTTSATLVSQTGAINFVMNNGVNAAPYISRIAAPVGAGTTISYTLGNIVNPTTPNETFYVRLTTYTGSDGFTGPVDTGSVAASTSQPILLIGETPPLLVFCVGTSVTTDCSSMTGSSIDFGEFNPQITRSGTSVMQVSTNAANGYSVTITGPTLASGVNTIAPMAAQGPSITGASQFGLNIRLNTTPSVGANPSGPGSGTFASAYGTPNQFRYFDGDIVASATAPSDTNTFTSSYIVNIPGFQAAGVYTTTITYICTASF